MRNGLAIAGMAGGLFFLGQAVASASDAGASNDVAQVNDSSGSGGSGANLNGSSAEAKNVDKTTVDSSVTGGSGGVNSASVNTGVQNSAPNVIYSTSTFKSGHDEHEKQFTSVTFNSGDVTLTQNANGGAVNNSGNIAVAPTGGNQTATATNTVTQSNTSTSNDHHGRDHRDGNSDHSGPATLSQGVNSHHGDGNANVNGSDSTATNVHKVEVDSTVTGGAGGINTAEVNTGIIGNTFYCDKNATCTYNFHTGSVSLVQNANGGSVNGSGNIGIGAPVPGACDCTKPVVKADCPEKAAPAAAMKAAVKPAVKPAAKPAATSAAMSSAQPSGQLAYTGSDVSLPLTVGLLALVAGLGLTVLGRRREIQTV